CALWAASTRIGRIQNGLFSPAVSRAFIDRNRVNRCPIDHGAILDDEATRCSVSNMRRYDFSPFDRATCAWAVTEIARCSPSRRMSFDGRPQPDPLFGCNGLMLGGPYHGCDSVMSA